MKPSWIRVACLLIAAVTVGLAGSLCAADKPNYSGKYSDTQKKAITDTTPVLEVRQTEENIEVTQVNGAKRTTNSFSLNGSDGKYTSSGGALGTCKAQFKGKNLILDYTVVTRPSTAAAPMRVHTRERWSLSTDGKTLAVKSDVDFPDAPSEVSNVVGNSVSGTHKYVKVSE